jgi:hypothetical protein
MQIQQFHTQPSIRGFNKKPQPDSPKNDFSDYDGRKLVKDAVTFSGISAANAGISAVANIAGNALTGALGPWAGIPVSALVGAVGGFVAGAVAGAVSDSLGVKASGTNHWADEVSARMGGTATGTLSGAVAGVLGGFGISPAANALGTAGACGALAVTGLYLEHFRDK